MRPPHFPAAILPLVFATAGLKAQATGPNAPTLFSDPTGQLGPRESVTSRPMISPDGAFVAYYNGQPSIGGTAIYELVVRRVSDRSTRLRQDLTPVNQLQNPTRFVWGQAQPGDFPNLLYTWQNLNGPTVVLFDARTGATLTIVAFANASFVDVQRRPCRNLLAGVVINGTSRQIWTMNTTNLAVPPSLVGAPIANNGVVVFDVDPSETTLLAAEFAPSGTTLFLMSAGGTRTDLVTVSNLTGAGFGDNSATVFYSHTRPGSTSPVLTSRVGGVSTDLGDGASEGFTQIFVQPAHLRVTPGSKESIAYGGADAFAPWTGQDRLGIMPVVGGGDTLLYRSTFPIGAVQSPSIDRDGAALAFEGGDRNIHLVSTGEEIRVTPRAAIGTTISISNPTSPTQLTALYVNSSLQLPTSVPPVLGFQWVTAAGLATVYAAIGSPTGAPIVTNFTVPSNPSFVGLELDYQGVDLETTTGVLTFTRATRVRIL